MQVGAISTPGSPDWGWRIVSYAGDVVEESFERFPTIAEAISRGTRRLVELGIVDRSAPSRAWRRTSRLRARPSA